MSEEEILEPGQFPDTKSDADFPLITVESDGSEWVSYEEARAKINEARHVAVELTEYLTDMQKIFGKCKEIELALSWRKDEKRKP